MFIRIFDALFKVCVEIRFENTHAKSFFDVMTRKQISRTTPKGNENEEEHEDNYVHIIIEEYDRPVITGTSPKLLHERSDEAQLVDGW
jgi:hypothetical protein